MQTSLLTGAALRATKEIRPGSEAPQRVRSAVVLALFAAGGAGIGASPALAAPSTIEVVYSFTGGADGKYPQEALVEHAGVLYGTTFNGGSAGDCGTVFGLTRAPGVKTFTQAMSALDGCGPKSLAVGMDGQLYGVNETAGVGDNPAINYQGSAFRITTGGALTRLYLFDSAGPSFPEAGLIAGRDGNFYGTTSRNGGANGTVFRLTPLPDDTATVTHLHAFSAAQLSKPGAVPLTKLVEDATINGQFYGTTSGAAAPNVMTAGTLFSISTDGTYRLLRAFDQENERASGPLAQASDGLLYGTTEGGGTHGQGMVFRIATDGTGYQELHSFNATADQLGKPNGGLTVGADGNLYGVAGGVFKVTPGTGQVARLIPTSTGYSAVATRVAGNDLRSGLGGLLLTSDGDLYATAEWGGTVSCTSASVVPGTWGCGAVVRIVPGDATNLGGGNNGGGGGGGGGDGGGGGGTGGGDDEGGGGDGTTLAALLALLLGFVGVRRRNVLAGKRANHV